MHPPPRKLPPPYAHLSPLTSHQSARGGMWLYEPEPHIHYTQARGFLEAETLHHIRTVGDPIYGRGNKVWAVLDWEDVEGYTSDVRALYTEWTFARRASLAGACVLARSRVLGMGVTLVGAAVSAFGIPMLIFRERSELTLRFLEIAREGRREKTG